VRLSVSAPWLSLFAVARCGSITRDPEVGQAVKLPINGLLVLLVRRHKPPGQVGWK